MQPFATNHATAHVIYTVAHVKKVNVNLSDAQNH